jgi:hypothetical protein
MHDVAGMNNRLDGIARRLFWGSLNYSARFRVFEAGACAGESAQFVVQRALGESATLGGTYPISIAEALEDIESGFLWAGDVGSHPNRQVVGSEEYREEVRELLTEFTKWIAEATQLTGIWLKEGHPFYPVFWDYAFIVEQHPDAYVLIGSSSD